LSSKKHFAESGGGDGKDRKTKSIAEGFKLVLPAVRRGLYVSGDGEEIAHCFKIMNIKLSYIFPVSIAAFVCVFITTVTLCLVKKHTKAIRLKTSSFLSAWQFALSKRALVGAGIMPLIIIVIFYAFVVHIRLSLRRWPQFNENLTSGLLQFHHALAEYLSLGLIVSLYATGIMTLLSFAFKSLRFLSFSCLIDMVFVGFSLGLFLLLPHPFLNWLFD
jgi:hypothetical protein